MAYSSVYLFQGFEGLVFFPEVTSGKGLTTLIAKLAGKAHQFNKCVKKAMGHLKRLGDESDKER